jgi:uncharacterized protein with HEPN domain
LSRRSDLDWLQDVIHAAERIQRSIAIDKAEEFEEIIFDAIQYNLVCIGEAVRQISNDLKQENSDIPWQLVTGMRNRLTHEYFQISREQVETVLVEHLDPFIEQCKELKSQLIKQID